MWGGEGEDLQRGEDGLYHHKNEEEEKAKRIEEKRGRREERARARERERERVEKRKIFVNAVFPPLPATTTTTPTTTTTTTTTELNPHTNRSATSTKPNSPLRTTGGVGGRLVIPLASLDTPNSHLLISLGGLGGTGSSSLVGSPTRAPQNHLSQAGRRKVRRLRPARKGAVRKILLELKLIADVGMVGFPNAGKSSLMRLLCRADAKVGRYAFTTVEVSLEEGGGRE